MSNLFARLSTMVHGGEDGGYRSCYGMVVSCPTMLLFCFCMLDATVSVWKAFAFAGLALVAFGVVDCLAPESWCIGRRGGAGAEREGTAAAGYPRAACRFGLAEAAINALPTFAYASHGDDLCSVCLEDMKAGEMVQLLPTCKHLFHVGCIDKWLHSHRTCPMCRCDLSSPRKVTAKAAAVEAEPPADDASPPA